MIDDRKELGIPVDAPVWRTSGPLREGWTVDEIGVQIADPPPRPWDWPYGILKSRKRGTVAVVQVWRRTLARPGFSYSVIWHPTQGRSYRVESVDPDFASLLREAQRVIRREKRGRPRKRPSPEQYIAAWDRIARASGVPPSRYRMAEEYEVKRATVTRWLQRPEWLAAVQDKYRAE
jgi:hypothetical protein